MRTLNISTTTHGRVLVEDAAVHASAWRGLLVAFHGYGQSAEEAVGEVQRIPGVASWTVAAVQGLHRFYARDNQRVIASWMTRQDRELAIADNVAYVDAVVGKILRDPAPVAPGHPQDSPTRLVFLGFSQGVAMAYRAALLGRHEPAGIVALGGDVPPELTAERAVARAWPPVLVAAGTRDTWYTPARVAMDVAFLESRHIPHESVAFDGAHEWTDEVRATIGRWLARR